MTGMAKLGWHGTRKRANGKFQARWQDAEGLQSLGGFITDGQAAAHALRKANEALNVMVGLAVVRKPILEARDAFLDRRTKPNTRALNSRRVGEFLTAMPQIRDTSHLTSHHINQYARHLEKDGHNPGGQEHHLKIVRAFTNYCLGEKWLLVDPFEKFEMPKSEYEGRALTDDEYARMTSVGKYEVDKWLNLAFRLGHSTIKRISQIWRLTTNDFAVPNQLRIVGIKDQPSEWIPLEEEAVAIVKELLAIRAPGERLFSNWASVESMRNSVEDKARREGMPGVRFHDVCKVTAISRLSSQGVSLGDLAHLSNTSKRTLDAHYVKSDRDRAFANYLALSKKKVALSNSAEGAGHTGATVGPYSEATSGLSSAQLAPSGTTGTIENGSTSQ